MKIAIGTIACVVLVGGIVGVAVYFGLSSEYYLRFIITGEP